MSASVCVDGSTPLFISQDVTNACAANQTTTSTTGIEFIQNIGAGAGQIHKVTAGDVAFLRTLISSDSSVSITTNTDEIDFIVASSDKNFVFDQATPVTTVNITHNLGKFPSVTILDLLGAEIWGSVVQNTVNDLTLEFSEAVAFKAIMN